MQILCNCLCRDTSRLCARCQSHIVSMVAVAAWPSPNSPKERNLPSKCVNCAVYCVVYYRVVRNVHACPREGERKRDFTPAMVYPKPGGTLTIIQQDYTQAIDLGIVTHHTQRERMPRTPSAQPIRNKPKTHAPT